jgi:transcriptional regulator GlxA family with amidase domain
MSGLETVEEMFGVQPRHHVVVVAEGLDAVPTDTPVRVAATSTLDEAPEPDVVVVPGGGAPTLRQLANPVLLDYLRQVDRRAEVVASVCTGALLLAGAGLLEGRRATTHWAYRRFLDRLGAKYVPERWVEDDRYMTGAGVSAGIDMALRLAARLTNDDLARLVSWASSTTRIRPTAASTGPASIATCSQPGSRGSRRRHSPTTPRCERDCWADRRAGARPRRRRSTGGRGSYVVSAMRSQSVTSPVSGSTVMCAL